MVVLKVYMIYSYLSYPILSGNMKGNHQLRVIFACNLEIEGYPRGMTQNFQELHFGWKFFFVDGQRAGESNLEGVSGSKSP